MMKIGKTAEHAIAVMGYLVERSQERCRVRKLISSEVVGKAMGISNALAAKILSKLSRAHIIQGSMGPGGGYEIIKDPKDINFLEVVLCFESWDSQSRLFSNPLSEKFRVLEDVVRKFLMENNFDSYVTT